MSGTTRSGGRVDTSRQGVLRKVLGTVSLAVFVTAAAAGYLGTTQEIHVPRHDVRAVAASGFGTLSTSPDSGEVPDCCSEEGPSSAAGEMS